MLPVGELLLTETVNREYEVDRVTLVDKDKLPRVRKRLGMGVRVSEMKKIIRGWDFFESGDAFAVVRESGESDDITHRCLEIIREELSILAVSQLGYHKRSQMGPIVAPREVLHPYITYLAVSSQDSVRFGNILKRTAPRGQVVLDGRWKNWQDKVFFTRLLKILRGETPVSKGWRRELRRVAVMIGESIGTADLLKSFLWNWIALETLLTRQEDNVEEMLPKRAEALLGWARTSVNPDVTLWQAQEYELRIREVYSKRNALVHRGEREGITHEDVEFTDHLLLNLLSNLVAFPEEFRSKQALVEFSEKVEAERILKAKPRVRPRDLRFIENLPGPEPRVEIEYRIGEWRYLPQVWQEDALRYEGDLGPEPDGCYFRVSNTGKGSARVMDASVKDGGVRIMPAESTMPEGSWLHPGESAIFFVPGRELARAMLERGRRSSGWATFEIKESIGKRHPKRFEVPDLESRAAP